MTDFIVLALIFGCLTLAVAAIRRQLLRVHRRPRTSFDEHVESARQLLDSHPSQAWAPPLSRVGTVRPRDVTLRAPGVSAPVVSASQPTQMAASELLVLATTYLCAVQDGDTAGKQRVMSTVTGRELLAGLTLASRVLASEYSKATEASTAEVLHSLHSTAVNRHQHAIILA